MRVAIIPARGGSTRIPNKNRRMFHGKPIICYSIQTAKESGLFDLIAVSTDDQEIADIADQCGAEVLVRPYAYAQDEVGTQEVMRQALNQLDDDRIKEACCIYATSPLMAVEDLRRGHVLLHSSRRLDYAFSVGTNPLQDAGQFYWGRSQAFLTGASLYGPNTVMVPISADRVCDINTESDWLKAEQMYEALRGRG